MSLPAFWPTPKYLPMVPADGAIPLHELCERAGVPCRASGEWIKRPIVIARSDDRDGAILVDVRHGTVRVEVPSSWGGTDALDARYALGVLAYGIFDLVARESIKGQPWARIRRPPGPRRSGTALTNRERQRRYRATHTVAIKNLAEQAARDFTSAQARSDTSQSGQMQ